MDNDSNVIAFRPQQTPEEELPSLWAWARQAERYGHYVVRDADDGAIVWNDEGGAYIQTTIGEAGLLVPLSLAPRRVSPSVRTLAVL
jgi:hypothetical protein